MIGVLAHEIGHVVHRHTTRMVVEQGVLQLGLGLALGDVSAIVSTGSALLTGLSYRRSHEREADCYAIDLMRHIALTTAPMGQLLLAMAHDEEKKVEAKAKAQDPPESATSKGEEKGKGKGNASANAEAHPVWSLLSSHPETIQRATELEQGRALHCARP